MSSQVLTSTYCHDTIGPFFPFVVRLLFLGILSVSETFRFSSYSDSGILGEYGNDNDLLYLSSQVVWFEQEGRVGGEKELADSFLFGRH